MSDTPDFSFRKHYQEQLYFGVIIRKLKLPFFMKLEDAEAAIFRVKFLKYLI